MLVVWGEARGWVLVAVLAGVAAAITSAVSGGLTSAGGKLWRRASGAQPVRVTPVRSFGVQSERTAIRMTSYLALDDLPLGPGPGLDHGPAERDKWAREFGLVDAHHTTAVVHIDRASEAPVTLTGLEIRVHERAEPPAAFHIGALGGGSFAVRSFAVNLDASPPEVRYDPGSEPTGPPIRFPYDLSGEERELFYILARTREYDVRWSAELHWVAGGKAGVTVIDDGGKPFRTVAPSRARMHRWEGGRWVPAG